MIGPEIGFLQLQQIEPFEGAHMAKFQGSILWLGEVGDLLVFGGRALSRRIAWCALLLLGFFGGGVRQISTFDQILFCVPGGVEMGFALLLLDFGEGWQDSSNFNI